MELNQNHRQSDQPDNAGEKSNEYKDQYNQDKFLQTQHSSKRSESSRKRRSRPHSKSGSLGIRSRPQSSSRINESWKSTNAFLNFMHDFRKMQTGLKGPDIFRAGGEQWRNMAETEKQPFIDAANQNKKLKQSDQKQQRQNGANKRRASNKSNSSQKKLSPKKVKRKQRQRETASKKRHVQSDTETDEDTNTSGSIHNATTDCPSGDSDSNS